MTREEFEEGFGYVKKHLPADHEVVAVIGQRGYCRLSCVLLDKLLQRIPSPAPQGGQDRSSTENQLDALFKKKGHLLRDRAKLSNKFHECKTDDERAGVSEQIETVQQRLAGVFRDIEHVEKYGSPAPRPAQGRKTKKFRVPESDIDKARKLNSVRSYISKTKRQIRHIMRLPEDQKDTDRLRELEKRLKDLELQKAQLENAVSEAQGVQH